MLSDGCADMVSMARPFLADPDFVAKAAAGQAAQITPCIACNQACLDHTFSGKMSTCLVNPRACYETELVLSPASAVKTVAVVGAGPAGLSTALALSERGHIDVLRGKAPVGKRVAVIGAGGIGFDVAEFLVTDDSSIDDLQAWLTEWGVADPQDVRGGVAAAGPQPEPPVREVTLLQRKAQKLGKNLGKTTGWIHRAALQMKNVKMIGGVNYERIDADGLHVSYGEVRENPTLIAVDTIVLCAGQVSERSLADALIAAGRTCHVIGGADVASELDAKRAIDQGTRLAATL